MLNVCANTTTAQHIKVIGLLTLILYGMPVVVYKKASKKKLINKKN